MPTQHLGPSTAHQPDLNWSQIRETILMMGVAIGQIEHAMSEGHDSVGTLAESFSSMFHKLNAIRDAAGNLPAEVQQSAAGQVILDNAIEAARSTDNAIVAFQFYDRMSQRLQHVCDSVEALAELVSDASRLYNPGQWVELQNKIRSKYTMEEERLMFDAILQGVGVKEAIAQAETALASRKQQQQNDPELF
ncbi:MAG: hypothetical protein ACRCZ5_09985 [Burkholderiales bacterium]|jgi:hypothetical protein